MTVVEPASSEGNSCASQFLLKAYTDNNFYPEFRVSPASLGYQPFPVQPRQLMIDERQLTPR